MNRNKNKYKVNIENLNTTERLFFENETKCNELVTKALLILTCLSAVFGILSISRIINTDFEWTGWMELASCFVEMVICAWTYYIGFYDRRAKYFVMAGILLMSGITFFLFPLVSVFVTFGPTLLSIRYYRPKMTLKVTIMAWAVFILAVAANIVLEHTSPEVHALHVNQEMVLWLDIPYVLLYYVLPRTSMFALEAFIGYRVARGGRKLVIDQASLTMNAAIMSSELNTAAEIQKAALADAMFTSPDGNFSLCAGIRPARDVGGDFYDHFMVNDHLLVVAVADVSDKGLPAAMYGVEAQSFLRFALTESFHKDINGDVEFINLEKAMNAVNRQLSIHNMDGMFVTMWIGCFDTRSGVGKFINAGHTMPYIRKKDGKVWKVTNDPQFFLGTFEDADIKPKPLRLRQGDTLVLYTDGVTDARNGDDETFGYERLEKTIADTVQEEGRHISESLINGISGGLEEFIGDCALYDDMTLLTMSYDSELHTSKYQLSIETGEDSGAKAIDFINDKLKSCNCPQEFRRNLDIIIDEICTNVALYAYDGKSGPLDVELHLGLNFLTMRFTDEGQMFNPLEVDNPDVSGEPKIGGLGIYLIRNLADRVSYKYKDGKNELTIYDIWNM